MSHQAMLKQADRDGLGSVLILKDDANWSRTFLKAPSLYLEPSASRAWDFFHCGGARHDPLSGAPAILDADPDDGLVTTHCIGLRGDTIRRASS